MKKIIHWDLFSGIGGFSYAIDQVYGKENTKHIFVEIDPFATAVLKKHWPEGEYWGDIREFIADTTSNRCSWAGQKFEIEKGYEEKSEHKGQLERGFEGLCILTGGFPCQPFSQAGKRRGTQDNRFLWPEMFRVIQLTKPQWVIAENVYGLLTIEGGLVFEQVCSDLEAEGYSLQTLIIPAVSVNAPHRRDRVWIIAYSECAGVGGEDGTITDERGRASKNRGTGIRQTYGSAGTNWTEPTDSNAPNPTSERLERTESDEKLQPIGHIRQNSDASNSTGKRLCGGRENENRQQSGVLGQDIQQNAQNTISKRGSRRGKDGRQILERQSTETENERSSSQDWERDWKEVAFERCVCELDDGPSRRMVRLPDGTKISYAKWRQEGLKAFGNAIVPQVAIGILKAIRSVEPN